jgi:hypothetical protein
MINEWRGPAGFVDEQAWRARWVGSVAATWRAACFAGAAMHHATLGLGAVRLRCLLVGHDDRLKRLPNRLFLRCEECGRATRGWTIAANAPRLTAPVITRQSPVVPFRSKRRIVESPTLHLLHHQRDKAGFRS